jgi:uncharacterized protein DUF6174
MHGMTRQAVAVIALAILWAASCDGNAFGPDQFQLDRAQARWSAAGPASYDFDVRVSCFCIATTYGTVTVSVRNHQAVSVVRTDSGTVVDSLYFQNVLTVDRMFADVRRFLDRDPARFHAAYDATLGFPTAVSVDPNAQTADDEYSFQVLAMRGLPTP